MKRFISVLLAFATVLASLSSCQKDGVSLFDGNYSFKTSGTMTLRKHNVISEPITARLLVESGQMDITDMGEDGRMLITMSVAGGDILALYGSAQGKELVLDEQTRMVGVNLLGGEAISSKQEVTVEGSASRYEDIVLFNLEYSGTITVAGSEYDIIDSDVICRAKLNR